MLHLIEKNEQNYDNVLFMQEKHQIIGIYNVFLENKPRFQLLDSCRCISKISIIHLVFGHMTQM